MDDVIHITKEVYMDNEHLYEVVEGNLDTHILKVKWSPTGLSERERQEFTTE